MNFEDIDRQYYYDGVLGAEYSPEKTVFRMWSPLATGVLLRIFPDGDRSAPVFTDLMHRKGNIWELTVEEDLEGMYYSYMIDMYGKVTETIDIYAHSSGLNGKRGMIFDPRLTDPKDWDEYPPVTLEKYTDAVIYELHVRDMSTSMSANFRNRGKFMAFCETGVLNNAGEKVGLDYFSELGVTHIHLLPVMDFASVDELGLGSQFNWGYDPLNYNVPEGSYSVCPWNGKSRVRELKELVLAAHKRGIGIVLDVVYNHTWASDDSPFGRTFPGYWYRQSNGQLSNGSGCGNEIATERRMVRKFICDSLCWLASEYKLDGFRFDLMGLLDIETLEYCRHKLLEINPSIILYGEGWTGGLSPLDERRRAVKWNSRSLPGFAMFSDDFRDSVKGSVFADEARGYVNGDHSHGTAARVRSAICGGVFHHQTGIPGDRLWTDSPCCAVNYTEAHDNLTFRDKLYLSMPEASERELIAADRLGAALVILSRGIPFLQAGQEFFRSKPLPDGGFDHNSYRSPDRINSLNWDELTKYHSLMEFYRGLIAIRRKFPEFRVSTGDDVRSSTEFHGAPDGIIDVRIGRFRLVINPTHHTYSVFLVGDVYADHEKASAEPMYNIHGQTECKAHSILLVKTD